MEALTLVVVSCDQQKTTELCLKSYVKHHYNGIPLNILLVDNGSTDNTKTWLKENQIPFIDLPKNVGHQEVINLMWNKISTPYVLLADTDVEFQANVYSYISLLKGTTVSVGSLMHNPPLHPRIGPWFWFLAIQKLKDAGVQTFSGHGCPHGMADWTYDNGSWLWEKIQELGLTNYNLPMTESWLGQRYEKVIHYSQISTRIANPTKEVRERREIIKVRVKNFEDIDLRNKFRGENTTWTSEFLDAQMTKGWNPIFYDN